MPEGILREMEEGLAELQQGRERLYQEFQQYCRLRGLDEMRPVAPGRKLHDSASSSDEFGLSPEAQGTEESWRQEIDHLESELEQRTTDFQRVQADYEALLDEYQRVFADPM